MPKTDDTPEKAATEAPATEETPTDAPASEVIIEVTAEVEAPNTYTVQPGMHFVHEGRACVPGMRVTFSDADVANVVVQNLLVKGFIR